MSALDPLNENIEPNNRDNQNKSMLSGNKTLRLGCICHFENKSFDCTPVTGCTRDGSIPTNLEPENVLENNHKKRPTNFDVNISNFVYATKFDKNNVLLKKVITPIPKDNLYVVGETSIASNGSYILYVGNRYAARSVDNGTTWEYIDPKNLNFPTFCCDQRVIYDPHYKQFIWILQEHPIITDVYRNIDRIGISKDLTDWAIYDIKPLYLDWKTLGNRAFDFPNLEISNRNLYITSNVKNFNNPSDYENTGSVILRFSLANISKITSLEELAEARNKSGNQNLIPSITTAFFFDKNASTITPVQGSSDQIFLATHINSTNMRIYQWSDDQKTIKKYDRAIEGWNEISSIDCNKGAENFKVETQWWCGNVDSRITGGWLYDNIIGFLWTANRTIPYGTGQLTIPYIDSAVFDVKHNMNYLGKRPLANSLYPWLYGTTAVNSRGELGLVAFYGNNKDTTINVAFGVNNHKLDSDWKMMSLVNSTAKLPVYDLKCAQQTGTEDCEEYKWGDFITIRPHNGPNKSAWDISAYVLNGTKTTDVVPYYFVTK